MPIIELMGWNKTQRRWFKKYLGKIYSVSPKQLGAESTKEASKAKANEWWEKKQTEIDTALGEAKKHPAPLIRQYSFAKENHRLFAKWHRKYGDPKVAEKSEAVMEWLNEALKWDYPPFPLKRFQEDPLYEARLDDTAWILWNERIRQIRREEREEQAVPKENTIRAHIDDYLTFRRTLVAAGKNTLGTYDTFRGRLLTFRNWVDPFAPVDALNETLWERYYAFLSTKIEKEEITRSSMASMLMVARQFIRSRYERRFIELPRNLNAKTLAVSPPLQVIIVFTMEEIKALLKACLERERLYMLLMMNCGFYPVDIAKLTKEEYRDGRIIRKRTKTRHRSKNVPVVDYLLWKETDSLLKKYQSKHPELVLINRNGHPLWKEVEKRRKV